MGESGGIGIDCSALARKVGEVRSIFPKIRVVGIQAEVDFKKGSKVLVMGPDGDRQCEFKADSLEIDHKQVDKIKPGDHFGIQIECSRKQLPKRGDILFLVPAQVSKYEDPLDSQAREQPNRD